MIDLPVAISAFMLGLAGVGHCMGMCGGIAAALNLGAKQSIGITLAFHSGRILSYTLLGGFLGMLAGTIEIQAWTIGLRYLAAFLLIGMGLYVANWWQGMMVLERLGSRLWQPVQRMSSRWLPIRHSYQALALGLCWGLMPCGLIYSSLAWAATAHHAPSSAMMMLCFGLGTLPGMLAVSFGAAQVQALLAGRSLKKIIALSLIVAGLWTLYGISRYGQHADGHQHHQVSQ
jgi:sulfite exporter TauE/SafE